MAAKSILCGVCCQGKSKATSIALKFGVGLFLSRKCAGCCAATSEAADLGALIHLARLDPAAVDEIGQVLDAQTPGGGPNQAMLVWRERPPYLAEDLVPCRKVKHRGRARARGELLPDLAQRLSDLALRD